MTAGLLLEGDMKTVAELIGHLEAVEAGEAEVQNSPVLQAVNSRLAYLGSRVDEAKKEFEGGIADALDDAELFIWNDETDGPFPFDLAIGSLYGLSGVVCTPNTRGVKRKAEINSYEADGGRGGSRVLVFPPEDDGKFYVLSFRNGRTQYDIDIRAVWEASR